MAGIHLQLNPSIYVHVHRPGAVLFFFPPFFFFFLSFFCQFPRAFRGGKERRGIKRWMENRQIPNSVLRIVCTYPTNDEGKCLCVLLIYSTVQYSTVHTSGLIPFGLERERGTRWKSIQINHNNNKIKNQDRFSIVFDLLSIYLLLSVR